jgi:polysaccharide pyruvyl transferase WcaK-like protein
MKIIQLGVKTSSLAEFGLNYLVKKAGLKFKIELGGPGKGNAGDTAIGQSFKYLFKKEFTDSKIRFKNCRIIFTEKDISEINSADILFVGGGGLFLYDSFPNLVSDWQWGISEDLLDKINIPIVVYSVGFNKFRGQLEFNENFNETVTKLIAKSIFFGLRDTGSCNAIKRYVPDKLHKHIKLNYCPTLLFVDAFNFQKHSMRDNSVGFVIAGDRLKNRHRDLNKYIQNMKNFVEYLKSEGRETILINHNDDYWLSNYIKFNSFIDLNGKDSNLIYKTYFGIDTVVGDRGHSQLIPFACGCKILTPISHDKLGWFLEDMGLKEFGVEESDENLSYELIDRFNKLQSIDWSKIWNSKMDMIKETNAANMIFIKQQLNNAR